MNISSEIFPDGFDGDDAHRYRECYKFNSALDDALDDEKCIHCEHFLTLSCKYIDEFVNQEDD